MAFEFLKRTKLILISISNFVFSHFASGSIHCVRLEYGIQWEFRHQLGILLALPRTIYGWCKVYSTFQFGQHRHIHQVVCFGLSYWGTCALYQCMDQIGRGILKDDCNYSHGEICQISKWAYTCVLCLISLPPRDNMTQFCFKKLIVHSQNWPLMIT